MVKRRANESPEDFRLRESAYLRNRYANDPTYRATKQRQNLDRYRRNAGPNYQPLSERSTAGACSRDVCEEPILARKLCYRHYREAQRAAGVVWSIQSGGRRGHQGRARRYGVAYEPIDARKVFARDGWRCGICGEGVDRTLRSPDPLSASLDHVVSMSKGGGHVYENVQCSHLVCNVRKGAAGALPSSEGSDGVGSVDRDEWVVGAG